MSAIIKPTPEKKKERVKRAEGDKMRCVKSHSNAYIEGEIYEVVKHPMTDTLCLKGKDGLYDPLDMLVSVFRKVD